MDKIKVSKLVKRKETDKAADPYSLEEINALLQEADKHRPEWRPYWQFAFFSGLRTSEQYGLKWTDLDRRSKSIHVQRAVVERQEKATKTKGSNRSFILLPMAYFALQDQRQFTETWLEHIFFNPRTNRSILDYEESSAVLRYLCKCAGLRYRMQRQTRHSFASNLLSGGENPYRVADMLGHKNVEMVFKVYGTWIDQGRNQGQEFLSEFANVGLENGTVAAPQKVT